MRKMRYCTRCILPDTHETVQFDGEGVCNICRQAEVKHHRINWEERKRKLLQITDQYKNKGNYDCIVPFSGGKDSTFQLWYVVNELKLKPLVVRYNHWGYRPLVHENNIRTFKELNVDVLEFRSSFDIVKKLMLQSLKSTGDFCWHCHTGIFANTMRMACKFNIPLVIWGEPSSEYRGYHSAEELEELDENAFNEMINLGITADTMYGLLNGAIEKRDLSVFQFPSKEEIDAVGVKAIYLGNYIQWNTKEQVEVIKKELGWKGQQVEGIPEIYDYEKIECRWQGIRDYCKYIKRGHGRTNHLVCIDIRNGKMDRATGFDLAQRYDGKRPASLDDFLKILGITEDEFEKMLMDNAVSDWGFSHDDIVTGQMLSDYSEWDDLC